MLLGSDFLKQNERSENTAANRIKSKNSETRSQRDLCHKGRQVGNAQ